MQELINSGVVLDTMITNIYTLEQKKNFLIGRHKDLWKMKYLILYAQQVSIDASKTGIKLDDNAQKILK